MKTRLLSFLIASLILGLVSCKKDKAPDPINPDSKLVRIQQGVDPDLYNDTVYLLSYNPSGKVVGIMDSIYQYGLSASYDASGRLEGATDDYGDDATYTYDANGQLTQIDYTMAGSRERFVFTYTNGVVSKKSYYSDFGSGGTMTLWRDYVYTVSGGNITTIKEYTAAGALVNTENFTYGNQANIFKELGLFNYGNILGTGYLMNFESHFNKNLPTAMTSGGPTMNNGFTYNSQQQLTKVVSTDNSGGVFTWQFSYE